MPERPILVVEDDEDIRETLQLLLELEGYAVVTAEHGRAALELLMSTHPLPKLIILDMMMPEMDGGTFLRVLHAEHRDTLARIPVIIATAGGSRASSLPPVGAWLTKPVDIDVLLSEVRRLAATD